MEAEKKSLLLGLGVVVLCVASFYIGGLVGVRRAFKQLIPVEETEVAGNLSATINQLSYLRSGESDRAERIMEIRAQRSRIWFSAPRRYWA